MFDFLKNMGNLPQLMAKAKQMQEEMKLKQEELAKRVFESDAGGGMVRASVNGKLELVRLRIDKEKIDVNDTEMLEDVTAAAVRSAQRKAAETVAAEMAEIAENIGIPPGVLPGMG